MIQTLAMEAVVPVSIVKPIVCLVLLGLWGRWAMIVDKDAAYFNQNRKMWNLVQIGAAAVGFLLLLFVPFFIVGLPLGVAAMVGAGVAYAVTRNKSVAEPHRWHLNADLLNQALADRREQAALKDASLRFPKPPAPLKSAPAPDDVQYEAHLTLEQFLEPAIRRKAQRLEMAASESQFVAQLSVDGLDYRLPSVAVPAAIAAMDYLKAHAKLDLQERRKKQTGTCIVENDEFGAHTLQVTTAGSSRGLTCTIVIDPVEQVSIPFDQLGLLDLQLQRLSPVLQEDKGVVLVASPSRQGRTTTFYGLLSQHDPYTVDIHTLETDPERDLEGVNQHQVEAPEIRKRFESLMLRDPQVVGIGQLTDPEVAQSMAQAATDGKRLYATVKADDTFAALKMWIKAVGETDLASRSISAIVAQRLVRKLCETCRQKYKPDPNMLRKLNLPADRIQSLYKAGGKVILKKEPEPCPDCAGSGYAGRVAAFEVMVIDDEARKLIKAGRLEELRAHLRRGKMMWLGEAALSRAVTGVTSITEVTRSIGDRSEPATALPA